MSSVQSIDQLLRDRLSAREASNQESPDIDALLQQRLDLRSGDQPSVQETLPPAANPASDESEKGFSLRQQVGDVVESGLDLASEFGTSVSDLVTGDNRIEGSDKELGEFSIIETFTQDRSIPAESRQAIINGFAFTSDPEAKADILAENLPGAVIERDKFNNPIVIFRGADGEEKRKFVNTPGLSGRDIGDAVGSVAAFLPASKAAGLAKSILGRVLTGAAAGTATSLGLDAAAEQFGSNQGVDLGRAGLTGLATGAAETINPLVARITRLVRGRPNLTATNRDGVESLSRAGREFVKKQGLNPDDITAELARQADNAAQGATQAPQGSLAQQQSREFGIDLTRGQATGNVQQLQFEDAARQGSRTVSAQNTLQDFANQQAKQIDDSVQLVQQRLLSDRANVIARDLDAANVVDQGVKRQAQILDDAVSEAYKPFNKGQAQLNVSSLSNLRKSIFDGLKQSRAIIDPDIHPMASKSLAAFRKLQKRFQNAPEQGIDVQRLEVFRQKLNTFIGSAKNRQDKMYSVVFKRQFDRWYDDAVDSALFSGDRNAVAAVKKGRSLRRIQGELFEARSAQDRAGKVIDKIVTQDLTPEQTANYIIGKGKLGQIDDSVHIVRRLKRIFKDSPGQEMDAIRQMAFLRLVRDARAPRGQIQAGALGNQISRFLDRSPTLANELYSAEQRKTLRSYASVLRRASPESFNPSKSGFTIAREARAAIDGLLTALGFTTGTPALAILGKLPGIGDASKARLATQQVRGVLPRTVSLPAASGAAVTQQNEE